MAVPSEFVVEPSFSISSRGVSIREPPNGEADKWRNRMAGPSQGDGSGTLRNVTRNSFVP